MNNKKIIVGVAVGVAALTAAGILLYTKRSKKQKIKDTVEDATDNFKGRFNKLQRKAKREFDHLHREGEDFAQQAKDRASQWANKAGANL